MRFRVLNLVIVVLLLMNMCLAWFDLFTFNAANKNEIIAHSTIEESTYFIKSRISLVPILSEYLEVRIGATVYCLYYPYTPLKPA